MWAAVRFVYKRASTNEPGKFLFAFLPLISDPGDTERNQLYTALSKKDVKVAVSNEHPAMFACIMRRMGSSRKQLECHGFVCDSKEDAIMIAANLYRSLMETMKRQQGRSAAVRSYNFEISQFYHFFAKICSAGCSIVKSPS